MGRYLAAGVAALVVFAAMLVPAFAHDPTGPTPGAGPHGYPTVLCWDGTGDSSPLSPFYQPDQAPEIVRVQSNFQKRNMAAGEWLTWKPYWRNRWTGSYAPQEEFRPGTYVPPGEFPHPGSPLTLDLPSSPWDNHGKLSFARGYYDVGAAYGWWGGPARGWIIDWNWLPRNVSNNGYLGLDLGNGNFIDYVCGLDPGRFLYSGVASPFPAGFVPRNVTRLRGLSSRPPLKSATLAPRTSVRAPSCFHRKATIVEARRRIRRWTSRADVIAGRGGDDLIYGLKGKDFICAGAGDDSILPGKGSDRVAGNFGDDTLLDEGGADFLSGGDGIDIIEGGPGSDRLRGGGQTLDILAYLFSPRGVRVNFRTGLARGEGSDSFRGFNAVVGSNTDDVLLGAGGEQWFVPLAGDDRVNGRSGRDIIVYLLAEQGVTVDLSAGSSGGQGSDRLAGLESVVGTQYADELMGDAGYNYLLGMQGNDVLDGIAGDDTWRPARARTGV